MKIDREAPIGVFDSGVGGLTVAREIMRNLPSEKIVYFGDTARVPYGSKSKETIIRYSRQIIRFLQQQQVKAIVVACNTASAFALSYIIGECCCWWWRYFALIMATIAYHGAGSVFRSL